MSDVLENEIALHYTVNDFDVMQQLTVSAFIERQLSPDYRLTCDSLADVFPSERLTDVGKALTHEEKMCNVWQPALKSGGAFIVKDDIEESLVSGISVYELHPKLKQLFVETRKRQKQCTINLGLNKAAIARLGASPDFNSLISIKDVALYVFPSGPQILKLSVVALGSEHTIGLAELCEVVYTLTRINNLTWQVHPEMRFRLGELANALIQQKSGRSTRVRASVFARVAPSVDRGVIDTYAARMAKHMTSDYKNGNLKDLEIDLYSPFENVVHALSFEGTCSIVVADENSPPALSQFSTNSYNNVYEPLALLQHQHSENLTILSRQLAASIADERTEDAEFLGKIYSEAMQCSFLNNSPVVSRLQLHNSYYSRLAAIRKTAVLSDQVMERSRILRDYISSTAAVITEKRMFKLELVSIAGVSFLTAFTIAKELMLATGWLAEPPNDASCHASGALWPCVSAAIVPIAVATFASISAFIWTYRIHFSQNKRLRQMSNEHVERSLFRRR